MIYLFQKSIRFGNINYTIKHVYEDSKINIRVCREPSRGRLVATEKEKSGTDKIVPGYNQLCTKFQNWFPSAPCAGQKWLAVASVLAVLSL